MTHQPDYEADLRHIIFNNSWLMGILEAARDCHLPDWAIGAGAIRSVAWDHLHNYATPTPIKDVDLVYFDPTDLTGQRDAAIERHLKQILATIPWEVTNQAAVHLWYSHHFGVDPVPPLTSTTDGIATWPETATCVGVRLEPDQSLTIIAPYGLDDLFNMVLRRNPRRVTLAHFRQRLAEKRITEKWPQVTIMDE
jgi:uncharacterized protein